MIINELFFCILIRDYIFMNLIKWMVNYSIIRDEIDLKTYVIFNEFILKV